MRIITNNVPRDVIYPHELTAAEYKEFDYYSADELASASFIRYRGEVYDLGEFMRWDNSENWDGFRSDSYFSGLVVRYCDDYDRVVVGLALA